MKTLSVLCAFAFVLCISTSDGNELESFPNVASESVSKHSPNLMNLPVEILLDIFERLDFKTLICVGATHSQNRNIVDKIFRNNFNISNKTFEISYGALKISGTPYKLGVYNDFNIILDFLQYFGHWITKLKLNYDSAITRAQGNSINEHISKYVVEFINELDLHLNRESMNRTMKDLNVPFPNAKIVKFQVGTVDVTTLRKMFPAIHSLDVETTIMPGSLEHFPYLEHFSTPTEWDWYKTETLAEKLERTLQVNPQLKNLTLAHCRWDIVKMLERDRPDLESLEISNFLYKFPYKNGSHGQYLVEYEGGPIQFNKMNKFKFGLEPYSFYWDNVPTELLQQNPFVFGNLEEFEFRGKEGAQNWVRVMLENTNLKKIIANDALNDEQLDRIADGLEKLEEFSMNCEDDSDAPRRVIQFIRKAKQLRRVSLLNVSRVKCPEVAGHISDEWKNIENSKSTCSFVRK